MFAVDVSGQKFRDGRVFSSILVSVVGYFYCVQHILHPSNRNYTLRVKWPAPNRANKIDFSAPYVTHLFS